MTLLAQRKSPVVGQKIIERLSEDLDFGIYRIMNRTHQTL